MSFLDIRDLTVVYTNGRETVHALNGINLTLEKGKTLGLVGETGAGKTTTALSIMRLLPERTGKVLSGSITLDGLDILSLPEKAMRAVRGARVSMIFQDPMTSLNPVIPVGEQILEALQLHNTGHKPAAELNARVDEILTLVGISPERKRSYPHEFSGGMKQRVVIAMALACSPDLLIADEPTTALDVTIQAQVLAMMDELKQRLGMSMIMITHDLGIVAQTCDSVAVVYAGEIIESGSFDDFFLQDERRHPYTRGLFGSIPDIHSRARRLTPIEGLMPDPTDLPDGCRFHPRCPYCTERCKTEHPAAHDKNGHVVCCHLYDGEVQ